MDKHGRTGVVTPSEELKDDVDSARRETLKAVGKYAAFLAGTSAVILTPEQALAKKKPCSQVQNPNPNNCI